MEIMRFLSLTSTLSVSNLNVELRDLEVSITGGSFFTCSSSDIEVVKLPTYWNKTLQVAQM